eukprot:2370037-Rhodomonas_salina.3
MAICTGRSPSHCALAPAGLALRSAFTMLTSPVRVAIIAALWSGRRPGMSSELRFFAARAAASGYALISASTTSSLISASRVALCRGRDPACHPPCSTACAVA